MSHYAFWLSRRSLESSSDFWGRRLLSPSFFGFGGVFSARRKASSRRFSTSWSGLSVSLMTTFIFLLGDTNAELYSSHEPNRSQTPNNIQMDDVIRLAESDPFWALRGKAIQGYAELENALSSLMAELSGMPRENASTVFYKITNTGSRTSILERLLNLKHGSRYNPFWNAYFKELRVLDARRSEIAHWIAAANTVLDDNNILHVGVSLIHPDQTGKGPIPEQRLSKHLVEFQAKCEIFAHLANMFTFSVNPHESADPANISAWLEIFQQPLVYPLPKDHLLFGNQKAPDTPPGSSPA